MRPAILLGYYAEYLSRYLPRFGIDRDAALALLRDLMEGPAARRGAQQFPPVKPVRK